MKRNSILTVLLVTTALFGVRSAWAGQAPAAATDPDIPISHRDRVYSAEQFSNTVSVTDPVDNKLVGAIHSATRCRPVSARFIPANCWCTAWDFPPITAPLPSSRSARMP